MAKVIFFGGLMASGKSTAARILKAFYESKGKTVELLKFAGPIHQIQSDLYKGIGLPPIKNRLLMQQLGDLIRSQVDPDYFVNALLTAITVSKADIVIVDDLRFQKEFDAARSIGATLICVSADTSLRKVRATTLSTWSENGHPTEEGVSPTVFDYIIPNTSTLERLERTVVNIAEMESRFDALESPKPFIMLSDSEGGYFSNDQTWSPLLDSAIRFGKDDVAAMPDLPVTKRSDARWILDPLALFA